MNIDAQHISREIDSLVSEGQSILNSKYSPADSGIISFRTYVDYSQYKPWWTKVRNFLCSFLPPDNTFIIQIDKVEENDYKKAAACIEILKSIKEQVEKGYIILGPDDSVDVQNTLNIIFSHFHKVARQLRTRYDNRPTIGIEDEYDVQDLLHALLLLYFDDVRPEERTPSYAGGSSRQDFLLKTEKVVIETKKTRASLTDKTLGEELIIDIEKYRAHPDCKYLICFVYDPEGRLGNPRGIMNDLNTKHKGFAEVIIKPE